MSNEQKTNGSKQQSANEINQLLEMELAIDFVYPLTSR